TDAAYRKRKIARVRNPVVIDFWEKEAEKAGGEASLANMTPYITSKFNNFIANDYIRPIIGQPKSAFNFRKVMDEGKILLINLSKGKIGDINAGLLGMIFTGKFLMAALSRVDIPQEQRRPFYLFIDEFQNFATASIPTVLSEARKYRLSLVMAHQFIAQLTEETRDAIFGNVGSSIVFRVGVQDAEFLVKQFEPVFDINDLLNIDNYHAYVRLLIHGQPAPPFNIATFPPQLEGNDRMAREMQELSRLKYGVPRDRVEQSIYERLRS
ncbi:ATP-binding protein, partial [Candidatus Parcubacteria bacterium]